MPQCQSTAASMAPNHGQSLLNSPSHTEQRNMQQFYSAGNHGGSILTLPTYQPILHTTPISSFIHASVQASTTSNSPVPMMTPPYSNSVSWLSSGSSVTGLSLAFNSISQPTMRFAPPQPSMTMTTTTTETQHLDLQLHDEIVKVLLSLLDPVTYPNLTIADQLHQIHCNSPTLANSIKSVHCEFQPIPTWSLSKRAVNYLWFNVFMEIKVKFPQLPWNNPRISNFQWQPDLFSVTYTLCYPNGETQTAGNIIATLNHPHTPDCLVAFRVKHPSIASSSSSSSSSLGLPNEEQWDFGEITIHINPAIY